MTRRLLVTILLLSIMSAGLHAQDGNGGTAQTWNQCKQRFKSEKVAYITSGMGLTVDEAQKFWPIYNKYDAVFDSIGEARRKNYNRKEAANILAGMDEDKAAEIISTSFRYDQAELDARRQYHEELSTLFPQKRILYYYHLEHEFRRQKLWDSKPTGNSFGKSFKNSIN